MAEKKPGYYDFKGVLARPSEENLEAYIEKVRLSMCENLGRDITRQEAVHHISIFESWHRAEYKSSLKKQKPREQAVCHGPINEFGLDMDAANNRSLHNLREWCFKWERIKDGRVMASASDFYAGISMVKHGYKFGDRRIKKRAVTLMDSLKRDMKDEGIILSTRVDFGVSKKQKFTTTSTITHRYNCQYKQEIETFKAITPAMKKPSTTLGEFCNDKFGLEYFQKLFNMHDPIQEIELNFNYTTGITSDNLYMVLPLPEEQKKNPHRVIRLFISGNKFYIFHSELNKLGYSRGFKAPF